jgi:2-polyprenyl-3-methyl-5-hydroxy-6-metoxy-1,4-benzoquinol methylase
MLDPAKLRYGADLSAWPERLRGKFVELHADDATLAWIEHNARNRAGRFRTWLNLRLRRSMSAFDVNGLLRMHPMHLLSTAQWRTLLGPRPVRDYLDVGAGAGDVTVQLAPLCEKVLATEMSRAMALRLDRRGIECECMDVCEEPLPRTGFDLVTCLNVLDRCARPVTMLAKLRAALAPGGRLVIGAVFPHRPFYFVGGAITDPLERLDCTDDTWEAGLVHLIERHIEPLGLTVDAIARAPYLSGGDSVYEWYLVDDALVVASAP